MTNSYNDVFSMPLQDNFNNDIETQYMPDKYRGNVSFNASVISIPLDVYDNWTDVRNTIQWSSKIEEVFKRNYRDHSDYLVWQYIGTPQGVMRTYPAMSLFPLTRTTFDVRKRPWYNAGIGCPKDVVIMVDGSGSLDGLPLLLMKATFKRLVQQIISDMDYIAAIKVGETASFLTCNTKLMRATKKIKELLYREMEGVKVGGMSRWEAGLNLAFRTLNTTRTTAQCEKAVLIMSDETAQPIDDIVEKLNADKRVRVYSLSFRRNEAFFRDKLRRTACNNRGDYIKVLSYADIDGALQEIVKTGNEPLKGAEVAPTWSNAYKDLGRVGMVVTATLPLVVRTSPSHQSVTGATEVTFLGIVGLDFKASRIVKISGSILPLQCTMMIINNKGYPIYHPRISQYSYERVNTRLNKFQYTANNNKDFVELERLMIDKRNEMMRFSSFLNSEYLHRVEDDTDYHHGTDWYQDVVFQVFPLHRTPLSIAVMWASYPQKYYMYRRASLHIPTINNILNIWGDRIHYNFEDNACKIQEVLKRGDDVVWDKADTCSTFMFAVFTDIFLSQNLSEHFFNSPTVNNTFNVTNHFMITYTGISFFSSSTWDSDVGLSGVFRSFYHFKKSTRDLGSVSLILTPPVTKLDSQVIFMIKPLRLGHLGEKGNVSVQIAALGVEVEMNSLRRYLFPPRERAERRLLVDENGMIVLSYPDYVNLTGFLGYPYSVLFRTLLLKGVYRKIEYTECIHTCDVVVNKGANTRPAHNAAPPPRPTVATLLATFLRLLVLYIRTLLLFNTQLYQAADATHDNTYSTVDCCKDYNLFQRNSNFSKFTVESWCGGGPGCSSTITVSSVPRTNLILVTDHTPDCECHAQKLDMHGGRMTEAETPLDCSEEAEEEGHEYYVSFQSCVLGNYSSPSSYRVCSTAPGRPASWVLLVLSLVFRGLRETCYLF